MRNTRIYTFVFAAIVCLICAAALGGAVDLLRDKQEKNAQVDKWRNVLKAVGLPENKSADLLKGTEVETLYKQRIREGYVVGKEFVKGSESPGPDARKLFQMVSADGSQVKAYCVPVSGKGLWSTLYGFLALQPDLNTVAGLTFYDHKETPGLGGEIEKEWFTKNFKGKKILDEQNKLVSVKVIKGKADPNDAHGVDGISGATFTSLGVTKLLKKDLGDYMEYFNSIKSAQAADAKTEVEPNKGEQ